MQYDSLTFELKSKPIVQRVVVCVRGVVTRVINKKYSSNTTKLRESWMLEDLSERSTNGENFMQFGISDRNMDNHGFSKMSSTVQDRTIY